MKSKPQYALWILVGLGVLGVAVYFGFHHAAAAHGLYEGVDDSVVGKFAKDAGRPLTPLIDFDKYNDLQLFAFLLAGLAGGFMLGYYYRSLFGAKGGMGILPMCSRAVPALSSGCCEKEKEKETPDTGETPVAHMGGTPMPRQGAQNAPDA
jgi:hypothetical protein